MNIHIASQLKKCQSYSEMARYEPRSAVYEAARLPMSGHFFSTRRELLIFEIKRALQGRGECVNIIDKKIQTVPT